MGQRARCWNAGIRDDPGCCAEQHHAGTAKRVGRQFKASPQERRVLLEAQENRVALPKDIPGRLREFLISSWSYQSLKAEKTPELGFLLIWNEVALQATALDHTNPDQADPSNPPPYFGEQIGPPRTSRVLAIVQLAIFEAVNTISPKYQSYKNVRDTILDSLTVPEKLCLLSLASKPDLARDAKNRAIVEAAYQTLVNLYPKKKNLLDIVLELSLEKFKDPNAPPVALGARVGRRPRRRSWIYVTSMGRSCPTCRATTLPATIPGSGTRIQSANRYPPAGRQLAPRQAVPDPFRGCLPR